MTGTKMPFAADCERHENGMVTAGPGPSVRPARTAPAPRQSRAIVLGS